MPITILDSTITGLAADGLGTGVINGSTLASGAITNAKIGYGGSILQYVQANKTDPYTATAPSHPSYTAVTGLSVTITPRSTSSKIMLMWAINYDAQNTNSGGGFSILRNGSRIDAASGNANGSNYRVTHDYGAPNDLDQTCMNRMGHYMDSPATTSAITYAIGITGRADGPGAVWINRARADSDQADDGRFASTIIALEISG